MLHWPEAFMDETLYSWFARMARMNGVPDALEFCNDLAVSRSASIMDCRFNLVELCDRANGGLGDPARILREMTWVHLAARLGAFDSASVSSIESGIRALGLSGLFGNESMRWRACPKCMIADVRCCGVAWWHRQHQLPSSLVCARHAVPLMIFSVARYRTHERFVLPGDLEISSATMMAPVVTPRVRFWTDLAKISAEALEDMTPILHWLVVRHTFMLGLRDMGLMTRRGNLRYQDYAPSFDRYIGMIKVAGIGRRCDSPLKPSDLLAGISCQRKSSSLLKLFLVYWLFGSWPAFQERCRWEAVLGNASDEEFTGPMEELSGVKVATPIDHRAVCRDFLETSKLKTRTAFWHMHPHSHRWLKRHDAVWLDEQFPERSVQDMQLNFSG